MTASAPPTPAAQPPSSPPADWYNDPSSPNSLRYWDGSSWTDQRGPRPQAAAVPVVAVGPAAGTPARQNSKATASMVLGICGIVVLPIVFSVLAIIFAVSARSEIDRNPGMENRGRATAGLWLGIAGLAFWALLLIAIA